MPFRSFVLLVFFVVLNGEPFASGGAVAFLPGAEQRPEDPPPSPKLSVGDLAPPLVVDKWLRGEPATLCLERRLTIVDFWAVWCGPCIDSMPHMVELQKKYSDLTVVVLTDEDPKNSLEQAEEMLNTRLAQLPLAFGWDSDSKIHRSYLEAAGKKTLPTTFLVDRDGRIAYIGHPMWLEVPLARMQNDTWDREAVRKELEAAEEELQGILRSTRSHPRESLKRLDVLEGRYPAIGPVLRHTRYRLLVRTGDPRLGETGRRMLEKAVAERDANALMGIAWELVDPQGQRPRTDLELAMLAAQARLKLLGDQDPSALSLLARVHYCSGSRAKAIETQKAAILVARDEDYRSYLARVLAEYEGGESSGR